MCTPQYIAEEKENQSTQTFPETRDATLQNILQQRKKGRVLRGLMMNEPRMKRMEYNIDKQTHINIVYFAPFPPTYNIKYSK